MSGLVEFELLGKPNLSETDRQFIETMLESCFITEINHEIKLKRKKLSLENEFINK